MAATMPQGMFAAMLAVGGSATAKGDLTSQKAILVPLTLGSAGDKMIFSPQHLTFETGKLYKLLLTNPSPQKHELDAAELAEAVYSKKVEVVGPNGSMPAEITGSAREIEVGPGATVEWYFVPVRTVNTHREAGQEGLRSAGPQDGRDGGDVQHRITPAEAAADEGRGAVAALAHGRRSQY